MPSLTTGREFISLIGLYRPKAPMVSSRRQQRPLATPLATALATPPAPLIMKNCSNCAQKLNGAYANQLLIQMSKPPIFPWFMFQIHRIWLEFTELLLRLKVGGDGAIAAALTQSTDGPGSVLWGQLCKFMSIDLTCVNCNVPTQLPTRIGHNLKVLKKKNKKFFFFF